jgi:hypothetical protein
MAGLIVVQNGVVQVEKYRYDILPSSPDVIQSCEKSFISTASDIAIAKGEVSSQHCTTMDPRAQRHAMG